MSGDRAAEAFPPGDAVPEDPVEAAVIAAYRKAGLVPGGLGPVAPLRRLVASYGLVVEEIRDLSLAEVHRYFRKHGGPSIKGGEQDTERLAGFLYANAAGGWILTELGHPLSRRRFTIAHEIGHYMLHFLPAMEAAPDRTALELREELTGGSEAGPEPERSEGQVLLEGVPPPGTSSANTAARMEEEADRFAAALLLPSPVVRDLVTKHAPRCGSRRAILARLLAGECLVSTTAAGRRLGELGLGQNDPVGEATR